jgi:hypothetical protein
MNITFLFEMQKTASLSNFMITAFFRFHAMRQHDAKKEHNDSPNKPKGVFAYA